MSVIIKLHSYQVIMSPVSNKLTPGSILCQFLTSKTYTKVIKDVDFTHQVHVVNYIITVLLSNYESC